MAKMSVNDPPTDIYSDDNFFESDMEENQSQESDNSEYYSSETNCSTDSRDLGVLDEDQTAKNIQMSNSSPPAYENSSNNTPMMNTTEDLLKDAERNGRKFIADGKINEAVHELVRAMTLTRVVFGATHWRLAASYVHLAEIYLQGKGYTAQAEYHAERAKSLMLNPNAYIANNDADKVTMYTMLVNLYHILAVTKCSLRKYGESEKSLQKAECILENLKKLCCSDGKLYQAWAVTLVLDFAQLYSKQKKQAEAVDRYKQATELIENVYGKESLQLIAVFSDWGKFVQLSDKRASFQQSIELLQKAHSIAAANCNQNELIKTALILAQTYSHLADEDAYESAESYLRECLSNSKTVHGENHLKTLTVEDELVRVLLKTNRHKQALQMLQSGTNRKCALYGYYSEEISNTHSLIASVHLADGNIIKALKSHQQCFEIQNFLWGPKHRKTINTKNTIEILKVNPAVSSTKLYSS